MTQKVEPIIVISKDKKLIVKSKPTFAEILKKEMRKHESRG